MSFKKIIYFFPFQLLFVHIKRNHLILIFWLLLFGYITQTLANKHGGPSLFLAPEYIDRVGCLAFFIYGFSFGGFIVAFNITSYMMNAHLFPFIASLSRPFFKYSINNFIIPLCFIATFMIYSFNFQIQFEYISVNHAIINISAFLIGMIINLIIAYSYFFSASKDVFRLFGLSSEELKKQKLIRPFRIILEKDLKWKILNIPSSQTQQWKVETYLISPFKIKLARPYEHYREDIIIQVLRQNRSSAAIFGVGMIISMITLGAFMDNQYFMIPAAASIILLFSIFLLIYSSIYALVKEWTFALIIIILLLINFSSKYFFSNYQDSAFGLNYNIKNKKLPTDVNYLNNLNYYADYDSTIAILNKWKKKNCCNQSPQKLPKIVIINTSGGALKSAIWTYYSLSFADSITNGEMLKHTQLITGASAGIIGVSYLRELYLQYVQEKIQTYYNDQYFQQLSKDILNPMAFSFAVNDWAFRLWKFKYNTQYYFKDRGYVFEEKLNENTGYVFDKPISAYYIPEKESIIPMIIITPTIINDGSKLLISPQPISYLVFNSLNSYNSSEALSNIEFKTYYNDFGSLNLRYSTALRMNSTYPYVSPVVSLPGNPRLDVMDAGIHDNYGITTALQFIFTFKKWIEQNTSGIIFIQITEQRINEVQKKQTFFDQLLQPVGNIYGNLLNMQNINNERLLDFAKQGINTNMYFINFALNRKEQVISLSWHLTKKEKDAIKKSIYSPYNQVQLYRLKSLLDD